MPYGPEEEPHSERYEISFSHPPVSGDQEVVFGLVHVPSYETPTDADAAVQALVDVLAGSGVFTVKGAVKTRSRTQRVTATAPPQEA